MGFISIKKDEAIYAHQDFYKGSFEVVQIKRSGVFDFPPFSFVYGISDIGSWDGLISTNGKKIVVTKSAYTDLSRVVGKFEFNISDIIKTNIGVFKTTLTLRNNINGLTKGSNVFQFRSKNTFSNLEKFNSLLK